MSAVVSAFRAVEMFVACDHRAVTPRAALVVLAFIACTPPAVVPPVEPPHFLWSADAQSLDNPFPDERLLATGALRTRWYQPFLPEKAITTKSVGYFRKVGAQFSRDVTALGSFGATLLRPSVPLDPDSLSGTVARLWRRPGESWQVLEARVHVEHPRDVLLARGVPLPEGYPEFLVTRSAVPLPEGAEGLLVVVRGARSKDGQSFGRGFELEQQAGLDFAALGAALNVPADDVLFALPQRPADATSLPKALAAWAAAHPPAVTVPAHAVVVDGNASRPVGAWKPTDPDWSQVADEWLTRRSFSRPASHVGQVVIGELAAKDLRENGVYRAEWTADPSLAPTVPLRFVVSLPAGPKPVGGWPMVLGQHGVGGRNTPRFGVGDSYCLEWAEPLAARGLGCIGIDAPSHGSRGTFTEFFSVDDLPALRDRLREMTFDLLQVEAAVVTMDFDGDGAPDVAPRVRYFGNSLGAIMGSGFVPVANRVSSAVLNVPGAGLSNVVMSPNLQDLIGLLLVGQTELAFDSPEYLVSFPLFRAVAQPLFDPGDPINLAQALPAQTAVLVQAGRNDLIVPNDSSLDLAAALHLGPSGTQAFTLVEPSKYLPAAEVPSYNGHNVIWDFEPVREQALKFLESDGQTLLLP